MTLRDQIKQLREAKGLTQAQLGRLAGYHYGGHIARFERGLTPIPLHKIPDLAQALGVCPGQLRQNYIPPAPKTKRKPGESICITCSNAYAHKCLWIRLKNPQEGLAAMQITDYTIREAASVRDKSYVIHNCHSFSITQQKKSVSQNLL